jgi:hypothetical protein
MIIEPGWRAMADARVKGLRQGEGFAKEGFARKRRRKGTIRQTAKGMNSQVQELRRTGI